MTINGSGFGSSQGSGIIWLGSVAGQVVSWSDTQVVAKVATGSVSGIARVEQNAIWSNALSFIVPGGSVTLVPDLLNMLVGDTHSIQALNASGQAVTGLTWTSSNTSIVSLSTDDPPILTALAVGHVTITAGGASADVTVSATGGGGLSLGTVLCSNPGDGSGVSSAVPVVPSATGIADVFALQNDGAVQAVTSDCTVAWSYSVPDAAANNLEPPWAPNHATIVPDFEGGMIVVDYLANGAYGAIQKVDGTTGQPYPAYNFSASASLKEDTGLLTFSPPVVHTDGTIFAIQTEQQNPDWRGSVVGIDPVAGTQKFRVPLPIPQPDEPFSCSNGGTWYDTSSTLEIDPALPNIVAADGNFYVAYAYNEFSNCNLVATHLRLLQVNSSGGSNLITILDANSPLSNPEDVNYYLGMISNADTGVVLTWSLDFVSQQLLNVQYGMAITTGTGANTLTGPSVPGQQTSHTNDGTEVILPVVPILQGQDGSFVGAVNLAESQSRVSQISMVAFDAGGNVLWEVPNETPQIATIDGNIIGQSGVIYDQNGNAIGQGPNLTESWRGNMYQLGSVDQILVPPTIFAQTLWAQAGSNPSRNGTASRPWSFVLNWQNAFDFIPYLPTEQDSLKTDISYDATTIKTAALNALRKAYLRWPVLIGEGKPNTGDHQAVVQTNIPNQPPNTCGQTQDYNGFTPVVSSTVNYECVMFQAQAALQIVINNAQDEANALQNQALIQAIGRGIGNTAAHEIAHQFLVECCSMDALTSDDPNAAATYNNGDSDGDPSPQVPNSEPATYTGYGKDGTTAIHWESTTQKALDTCLFNGWVNYQNCKTKYNLSQNFGIGLSRGILAKGITLSSTDPPWFASVPIVMYFWP